MFGADAALAGRLRTIASDSFQVPAADERPRGLLSKLGPMFRNNPGPVVPHGTPLPSDWENLLRGQYVAPERLDVSWKVLDAWVDEIDWGTWHADLSSRELDDFDFALTRAGLPSRFGLRRLMSDEPQLPLRPATGMVIGYAKNAHVQATQEHLAAVLDEVDGEAREPAHRLNDHLAQFASWTAQAEEQQRPRPDLFVVWWQTARDER